MIDDFMSTLLDLIFTYWGLLLKKSTIQEIKYELHFIFINFETRRWGCIEMG